MKSKMLVYALCFSNADQHGIGQLQDNLLLSRAPFGITLEEALNKTSLGTFSSFSLPTCPNQYITQRLFIFQQLQQKQPRSPGLLPAQLGWQEVWMAKVACQKNCWRLQDPLELQPTWKSPIPSCRESEQLAFLLSQNTIKKKGKKYWKAYMCTEYCQFCRYFSFHQSEQQYLSHHYK